MQKQAGYLKQQKNTNDDYKLKDMNSQIATDATATDDAKFLL